MGCGPAGGEPQPTARGRYREPPIWRLSYLIFRGESVIHIIALALN